jgi:hypothetical protein
MKIGQAALKNRAEKNLYRNKTPTRPASKICGFISSDCFRNMTTLLSQNFHHQGQ